MIHTSYMVVTHTQTQSYPSTVTPYVYYRKIHGLTHAYIPLILRGVYTHTSLLYVSIMHIFHSRQIRGASHHTTHFSLIHHTPLIHVSEGER